MRHQFADGYRLDGDAQEAGAAIEAIRIAHGGQFTAAAVLAEARKKRSPLHRYFEWDDSAAAEQYRLSQAAYLIRAIVVVPENEEQFTPVRAFVCVKDDPRPAQFTHVMVAINDEESKAAMMGRLLKRLAEIRRQYAALEEFAEIHPLFAMIDDLIA